MGLLIFKKSRKNYYYNYYIYCKEVDASSNFHYQLKEIQNERHRFKKRTFRIQEAIKV